MNDHKQSDISGQQSDPQAHPLSLQQTGTMVQKPGIGSIILGLILITFGTLMSLAQVSIAVGGQNPITNDSADPIAMATSIIMTALFTVVPIFLGIVILILRTKQKRKWELQSKPR
ncbi:DUF4064 domain-containing protein [Corynebacterium freiburgense]|uniref:DUF4064 domain-containing protein n=1 Tax=Corynebacterium freiburgense TaxID=556548 RepID=UPI0003FA9D5C|nr:DUF4064 domain-containing protein [Corynebacterium freiburgense]WJZ02317.1 hypothetical protein CFREI_05105 [Corynebacterium freiburgense]